MTRFHSITAALASLILLVACGGGAVTTPTPDPVTFADWVASPAPTGTAQTEVQLTFSDAFYDGNTDSGVKTTISTPNASGVSDYFVEILDTTSLGAPIADARRDGVWSGIMTFSSTIVPQFTANEQVAMVLDVNFASGDITSFTQVQNDYYLDLDGNFTDRGVISGDVFFGEANTAKNAIAQRVNNSRSGEGTLTGLIGQDGAVGGFYSDNSCPPLSANTCSGAFVGGFVALSAAHDTLVTYLDWIAATNPATDPNTSGNQFLQGDRFGVARSNTAGDNRETVDLTASRAGIPLGGEALDGVAFYQDGNNYYAGLYSSTRLGLPLNSPRQGGRWNGVLGYIVEDIDSRRQGENITDQRDMVLNVDFNRSSIEARVKATDPAQDNLYFNLTGTFNTRGVITGTTILGNYTTRASFTGTTEGTLVGLIGQDGAVAAFHSDAGQTRNPYAGGFVAAASRAGDSTVNYSDWLELATQSPTPTPVSRVGRSNQFLQGSPDGAGLNRGNDSVAEAGAAQGVLHFEGVFGGGDAADGVAYYQHDTRAFYAGVLSGTDLGANLSAGGTWNGRLEYVSGGAPISREMTLDIDFSAGSISSFVKATGNANERFYFNINGDFDGRGVISGTTTHGTYAGGSASATPSGTTDGTLTGLIGSGGAVGAFVSNDGQPLKPYAGGFVAAPNPPHPLRDIVEYSDWEADITRFTSLSRVNQFVKDGPTGVRLADANTVNVVELNFEPGEGGIGGLRSYRRAGTVNGVDVGARYAGIFENTNVGPAIANNNLQGIWKGRLSLSRAESVIDPININLDVNFNTGTNSGTIDSFVKLYTDSRPLRLLIDGTFDSNGIISGDTTMADFSPNESTPVSISTPQNGPADRNYSEGVLSGLIGVNGAIGVFHSDTTTTGIKGYSGGFVAVSPSFSF